MSDLRVNCKVWLYSVATEGVFGDGKLRLLEAIDRTGSLQQACAELEISYRKAWGDLRKAEKCLGMRLVTPLHGGRNGGSTSLSPDAQRLIAAYGRMRRKAEKSLAGAFATFEKELQE